MTSLLEYIDDRIAELRTEGDKQEPDSGKWFRLHKTADELVKVRQKVVEIIHDANYIRLVEVNCDPNDMRDKILAMLGETQEMINDGGNKEGGLESGHNRG